MEDLDSSETREINLRDYWAILVKRRWLGISFFLIVVVLTALYSLTRTKIYQGTAQVMIEKSNPNVVSPQEFFGGETLTPEFLQTQYRIIESRSLARSVVKKLNLTGHPEFASPEDIQQKMHPIADGNAAAGAGPGPSSLEERVVSQVMGRINVSPIRNSLLINLSFEARDPAFAARAANAVAAAYIDWNLALRLKTQENSATFLGEQVKEQKLKLEASEQAIQQYREKYGVVALNADRSSKEGNMASQKLVQVTTQLVEAQNKRIETETRYKKALELVKNPEQAESIPEVVTNPLVNQIKNQEVDQVRKKAELAEKFGLKHPAMVSLNQEIENLQKKKAQEIRNVVGSLRSQYDIAASQERSLREAASRSRIETLTQNKVSIDYQMLQQEAESNRTLYDMLLKRLKETNISEESRYINIHIVDPAEVPESPIKPTTRRNVMLAMVIGLMGGIGLIFFFEYLDNTVKTPDDVQNRFGLPYLGPVPNFEIKANEPGGELVILNAPKASASEAFRGLRTSLFFSFSQQGPKVVLITSADAREGKTLVAANLAVAMAQGGNRVLVLDCDMRRPRVHKLFNLAREPGMSNVLAGADPWDKMVKPTPVANLWVIPAGPIPPNPAELLTSNVMPLIIQELHQHYDRIIIDSPPIIAVTDSVALSRMADGVILVVKVGLTPREVIESALRQLKDIDAKVLGMVLNDVPVDRDSYYYSHYYYYHYHYGEEAPSPRSRGLKHRLKHMKRIKKDPGPSKEV